MDRVTNKQVTSMKKMVLASLMMVCLPSLAMAQSADDDLYFIPKKKAAEKKEVVKKEVKVVPQKQNSTTVYAAPGSTVVVKDAKGNMRDVDEYNRRYTARDNRFAMENDTLYIEEKPLNERGEWVNGFEGSQDDYEYAMRIVRFRNPRYAIPVSSPLYWDVVYGAFPSWDWNVYDDGFYAYAFPTYTNRAWWNWRYNYPYGGGWGLNWGWNSPWYSGYYGGGYYGGGYWGHHHHHHYPSYGWGGGGHGWSRPSYYDNRRGESRTDRYNGGRVDRPSYSSSQTQNGQGRVVGRTGGRVVSGSRAGASSVRPGRVASRGEGVAGSVYRSDRVRPSSPTYTRPSTSGRSESGYTRPSSTRVSVKNGAAYQRGNAVNRSSDYNKSNRTNYTGRETNNSSRSSYNSSSSSRSSYSTGSSGSSTRSSGGGGSVRRR